MALSAYITDTRELLRDTYGLFTNDATLTRWINSGRRLIAYKTGCLRFLISGQSPFGAGAQAGSLIPGGAQPGSIPGAGNNAQLSSTTNTFQTIPGVEMYPFSFATPYVQAQYAGVKAVVDIVSLAVSWGGAERPMMAWMPWDDLQAYGRAYNVGVFSYPSLWSTNGDGENAQLWLFPVPSTADEMEWDAICTPKDIYADSDVEALPLPFSEAVKYAAAYYVYLSSKQFDMADIMMAQMDSMLGTSRLTSDRGKTPNYYQTWP